MSKIMKLDIFLQKILRTKPWKSIVRFPKEVYKLYFTDTNQNIIQIKCKCLKKYVSVSIIYRFILILAYAGFAYILYKYRYQMQLKMHTLRTLCYNRGTNTTVQVEHAHKFIWDISNYECTYIVNALTTVRISFPWRGIFT